MILASSIACIAFALFGILLRVFKRVEVLVGFDKRKVADKDGLAIYVGNILLWTACFYAAVTLILWLADLDLTILKMRVGVLFILCTPIVAVVATIVVGFDEFMKQPRDDA